MLYSAQPSLEGVHRGRNYIDGMATKYLRMEKQYSSRDMYAVVRKDLILRRNTFYKTVGCSESWVALLEVPRAQLDIGKVDPGPGVS